MRSGRVISVCVCQFVCLCVYVCGHKNELFERTSTFMECDEAQRISYEHFVVVDSSFDPVGKSRTACSISVSRNPTCASHAYTVTHTPNTAT